MKTYQIETRTLVEQPTAVADTTPGTYPAGPPFARYRKLGDEAFEVEAGFPAAAKPDPAFWRTEIVQPYQST